MPAYRCRFVTFRVGPWVTLEFEGDADAVANEFHAAEDPGHGLLASVDTEDSEGGPYTVRFALVEVEGNGVLFSRLYHYGLYRRGGVRHKAALQRRLASIAKTLGWTKDPMALLERWHGEAVA